MTIHHIGIASRDLKTALESLTMEQSDVVEEIYDDFQGNILYFLRRIQQSPIIELVVPFRNNSTVLNFTTKNTSGLHHIGFGTTSLKSSLEKHELLRGHFLLKQYDIDVKTFGGKIRTAFVYANGTLIEYVENV